MHRRTLLAASLASPVVIRGATAQPAWPARPIALVVPFTAGGSTDIAARILADGMASRLGNGARIVVENRAGAGGSLGADYVRQRAPDGYNLLIGTASSHATNPAALPATTPYDPVEDFSPIAVVGGGPMVIVASGRSPFRTIQDLLAELRASPGALSFATSGAGGIGHLTGEFLLSRAGRLRAEHIPYRGGAQVMTAMASGDVQFSVEVLASAAPHLRDGTSRGLAVTIPRRHPLMPEIPSLAEAGLEGFDITTWNVLLGPKGLPPEILARLNEAAVAVLADPAVRQRMAGAGVDAADATTPEQTRAFLAAELQKFRGIVREAGINLAG
ncbi:Bug family tripartite tricarboxylate transporter substrate binding protein [Falsiroseomonas sp.]|uniref:Bug family tripartite tricarboxylate transporter substrate binding protein n=1 Tax=Falsiroseomonas sp. TaxID=2870721 RepID=UPI003F7168F0